MPHSNLEYQGWNTLLQECDFLEYAMLSCAYLCLNTLSGSYKGACHTMYKILGGRIIFIKLVLPMTPSGSLDQVCALDLRTVNRGSTFRATYSLRFLVTLIPRYLISATLCNESSEVIRRPEYFPIVSVIFSAACKDGP